MPNIDIDEANAIALSRIVESEPVLVDVVPAHQAIDGFGEGTLLHAGPPISWERMCGPMQGAIVGALRYERWADTESEALAQASGGRIDFHPAHHFKAVGPMTGITSPSMPVFVVENRTFDNRAYCTINEGIGTGAALSGLMMTRRLRELRWIQNTSGARAGGGCEA